MNTNTKIIALISTILLFVSFAGPAQATPTRVIPVIKIVEVPASVPITAPVTTVSFDRSPVETIKAPEPVVVTETPKTTPVAPVTVQQTPATAPTPVAPVQPATAPVEPVTVQSSGGGNGALLASARGQLGQTQDCTAMVERALGSIGIGTGDIAPAHFFRFGTVVGSPAPGDIIISAGHVGIYSGNGMMISGGFNGNQTVEHPISYVGGYSVVRVA